MGEACNHTHLDGPPARAEVDRALLAAGNRVTAEGPMGVASIGEATGDAPPHWMTFVAVEAIADRTARARELVITSPPMAMPARMLIRCMGAVK